MSVWEDIAEVAKDVAPTVATAVGGPAAGGAAKLLTSVFGGSSEKPEDLLKNMQADPKMQAKLKELEQNHAQEMRSLMIEHEKVNAQKMEAVNQTMKEEYKQGVYWRRAIGWAFAAMLLFVPAGSFLLYASGNANVSEIPKLIDAMQPIFYTCMVALGLAAHHEGKQGRTMAGEQGSGGLAGIVKAFKGN